MEEEYGDTPSSPNKLGVARSGVSEVYFPLSSSTWLREIEDVGPYFVGMNVVLEAWAMGRAVIASRTVGLTDYIQQNETGIFVEPSNVEDLRSKILYLLQQPDLAARLGQNGSKRVATDLNLERYIGILAAAIAKLRQASV